MSEKHDSGFGEASQDVPFGEELRREREMREIGIREIAETTKISTRFLEAIEQGDFSSLPAPVFTRGFIREYASYLGLDSEEIVDRYMALVERDERKREHEEEEMRERISGKFPGLPGKGNLKWILIVIVAIVILSMGAYYVLTRAGGEPEPVPEASQLAEPATTERSEQATDTASATAESIRMTLTARTDSWIDLQIDDDPPTDFTLQTGGSRTFEAQETIVLRTIGNAGGVEVELNGIQLEPLGRDNQVVRNVEFTLEMVNEMLQQKSPEPPENRSE